MVNWHKRYLFLLLIGLIFLVAHSFLACSMPTQSPSPSVPPSTNQPSATSNKPPAQTITPAASPTGDGWEVIQAFTGKGNQTTPLFHISDMEWHVTWTIDAEYPEYAVFDFFVYPAGKETIYVERVSHTGSSSSNTVYIYEGGQDYYIKVVAANLRSWAITIEEHVIKPGAGLSPVQITYIHYRGKIYPPDPEKQLCYERVEPDEYVEIQNLSHSPQDIRGWILKNESKIFPIFTFPPFFQSPYIPVAQESVSSPVTYAPVPPEASEYPKPCILEPYQTIRVYTDEVHPESGSFTFYYGPGNIWDNNKPDVAILYNSSKQEMFRKSYRVPAQNSTL